MTKQTVDREFRIRQIFAILTTVLVSIVYLRFSQLDGRLAGDLTFDDLSYAHDAAQRFLIASENGLFAFLHSFVDTPPHSPFSTLLALVAFAIGGLSEFAMYASNALILMAVTTFVTYELRHSTREAFFIAICIVLFSPLAYRTIHDFRPDIALGFATAVMAWLFIEGLIEGQAILIKRAGYAFGACLLIKPTFFAHTIAIALFLIGLAILSECLRHFKIVARPAISKRDLARFFGLGLIISSPYFLLGGWEILNYFWDNTRGKNASIWSFTENTPLLQLLKTYLWDKEFAFLLLGYHLVLSIVAILFCGISLLIRDARNDVIKISAMGATALVSLLIVVIGRHKNEFFLATFQWILLFSAIYAMATLAGTLKHKAQLSLLGAVLVGLLITMSANGELTRWHHPPESLRGISWNTKILDLIQQQQQHSKTRAPTIFVPFSGEINPRILDWVAMRRGIKIGTFGDPLSTDIELAKESANRADYVVLPNDLLAAYDRWMPGASIQTPLLKWMLNNARFKLLDAADTDPLYFVFANIEAAELEKGSLQIDGIPLVVKGFFNEEGPYPQWSLPRLRWMNNKSAELCVFNHLIAEKRVALRLRTDAPGALEISDSDGNKLASVETTPGQFQHVAFDYMPMTTTSCLNFTAQIDAPADPDRLVLFTKIELRDK